jgi:hydroxymethylpyrimidine/phosphomethylpyrimidine kinase
MTIAGTDSGGGAGVQADLKTFTVLGCYGSSAITALTAQNTKGVEGIHPVPPSFIEQQIDAVLRDIGTDALKIGMLHSVEVVRTVKAAIEEHGVRNVVLDPVMVAKSGDRLLQEDAEHALREELLPLADLLTPNFPEAEVLLGRDLAQEDPEVIGRDIAELGPSAVLLKGGHGAGDRSDDLLFDRRTEKVVRFEGERIDTKNTHGTGCTLSSAIAAGLAKGEGIEDAIGRAKGFLQGALMAARNQQVGEGNGPVDHMHEIEER